MLGNLIFFMVVVPVCIFMPVYLVKNPGANFSFEVMARLFSKLMKNITVQNYIRLLLALFVTSGFLEYIRDKEEVSPIITNWFSSGFRIYLFFFLIDYDWIFCRIIIMKKNFLNLKRTQFSAQPKLSMINLTYLISQRILKLKIPPKFTILQPMDRK